MELLAGASSSSDLPGTSAKGRRPAARTRCVALSPTNRCWAAASTEGLLLYSLDDAMLFDPTDLTEDLTPAACHRARAGRAYVRAILIALRLGDPALLRHCVLTTPVAQVPVVAAALPAVHVPRVVTALSEQLGASAHLEFLLVSLSGRSLCSGVLPCSSSLPLDDARCGSRASACRTVRTSRAPLRAAG